MKSSIILVVNRKSFIDEHSFKIANILFLLIKLSFYIWLLCWFIHGQLSHKSIKSWVPFYNWLNYKKDKMNHYKISYPYKVTKNGGNLSSFDCFISFFTHHYYNYHLPFNFCLSSCCGLTFNEGFLVWM